MISRKRFWRILLQSARVLERFRTSFIGKCSPVHFFWGSFDLAVTRFSGRRAPKFSGAGSVPNMPEAVVLDAYSHEVSSAGFWPGGQGIDYPAFYSYASPSPEGFAAATVRPAEAAWNPGLNQFLLPYDAVRTAGDPEQALMEFLISTYEAGRLARQMGSRGVGMPAWRAGRAAQSGVGLTRPLGQERRGA